MESIAGVAQLMQQNVAIAMIRQSADAERQVADMLAKGTVLPVGQDEGYNFSVYA